MKRPITIASISLALLLMLVSLAGAQGPESEGPESPGPESTGPEWVLPKPQEVPMPRSPGVHIDIAAPAAREFVRDLAGMIDDADEAVIKALCDKLLTETATPIIVVTIPSMADHGPDGIRIETYARLLFDQWRIGHTQVNKQAWNTGILLLVSRDDRKARIELGAGWGREKDQLCQEIMDQQIIPMFKAGAFSQGIAAGVTALDAMARSKPLPAAPKPPTPMWHYLLMIGLAALAIFTIVSLVSNGSGGWAWIFWGAVLGIAGMVLYQMITNSGKSSGGGGFSGGSFGDGFSGGGGATGSW